MGEVVSGVMIGTLLARPVSSLVADFWSWRAMFGIAALPIVSLFVVLLLLGGGRYSANPGPKAAVGLLKPSRSVSQHTCP
jgi:predicted MFS family arabinose efflux permease